MLFVGALAMRTIWKQYDGSHCFQKGASLKSERGTISKKEKSEFCVKGRGHADHVQKLEGADGFIAGKKALGNDSLQRRDGAADEEENDAHDGSFDLMKRGSESYIACAH